MCAHKILNIAKPNAGLQQHISKELKLSASTAQLLINRGIFSVKDAGEFLESHLDLLLDPGTFLQMKKAVGLLKKAAFNNDRILLLGDYDVDGVTSLAVIKKTLESEGIKADHYIPHRINEGYGLNKNVVKLAIENNVKLLITADCGTNNSDCISELRKHHIEVIVTDHHEPFSAHLADCSSALINPKVEGSGYGYRELAGVGVAYKFCQAFTGKKLFDDLDLVALGTIADSVPLTGENRVIAKEGLRRLSKTGHVGLKALIKSSGIENKKVSTHSVGFVLGPRINASGRLDSAEVALKLLMTQDSAEASLLADSLETANRKRQKIESGILKEALHLVEKEINFKEHRVMVIAKEGWHLGVLGVVAAKLTDRFYRPTILISMTQDKCRGSGRSIRNFHLFSGLMECNHLLSSFGGHRHAVGLTIIKDKIDEFREKINAYAHQQLRIEDLLPVLDIDMELKLSDINENLIREMELLEPFGMGNPQPLFFSRNLKLKGQPRSMGRETLKFWVTDGRFTCEAIGFGMKYLIEDLISADHFDLAYIPQIDSWQGEEGVILEVKDIFLK